LAPINENWTGHGSSSGGEAREIMHQRLREKKLE
jgi:hypothetical protein